MARKPEFTTQEPVLLEGYQAILKPSKFGYSMVAIIEDEELIERLDAKRQELVEQTLKSPKLKNPKRATLKPEPWEEVSAGRYSLKFSWKAESKPVIVDSDGVTVTNTSLPIYSGSTVRVSFDLSPYILKDGVTYGTSVKAAAIQLITVSSTGDAALTADQAADVFGAYEGGFKAADAPEYPEGDEDEDEGDAEF